VCGPGQAGRRLCSPAGSAGILSFLGGGVSSGSVASPLSTGGAGTIYEYRVAAVVLAALLRGDRVEGLEVPVTEVGLQQRIAGSYLDDVTAVAEHAGAVLLRVEFQVKRAVDPVPSDAEWRSVIAQCIAAFEADPDGVRRRHHLLGLAARAHAGHLGEVAELTRWAREQHEAGSFITVISAGSGAPNAQVRNRWQHLRTTVKDLLTEQRGTARVWPGRGFRFSIPRSCRNVPASASACNARPGSGNIRTLAGAAGRPAAPLCHVLAGSWQGVRRRGVYMASGPAPSRLLIFTQHREGPAPGPSKRFPGERMTPRAGG